jgi:hypothetical protein
MADILTFVRNTPRAARTPSSANDGSEIVVFPGASVGMLKALLEQPQDKLVVAALEGRIDN